MLANYPGIDHILAIIAVEKKLVPVLYNQAPGCIKSQEAVSPAPLRGLEPMPKPCRPHSFFVD